MADKQLPAHLRPTLAQLAAQSARASGSIGCPNCGCTDWRYYPVDSTYDVKSGQRKRRRICRHCEQGVVATEEVPVPDGYHLEVVPDNPDHLERERVVYQSGRAENQVAESDAPLAQIGNDGSIGLPPDQMRPTKNKPARKAPAADRVAISGKVVDEPKGSC